MHANWRASAKCDDGPRGALRVAAVLAVFTLALGDTPGAVSAGPPAAESAPQVKSAVDGVLDLFKDKRLVALGDWNGIAQEDAFYSALVRDPRFAEQVGNVVVEFGGAAAQDIIDRYVNGEEVPLPELRRVWTDVAGWLPGPFNLGFVNFFANVRAANLKLPSEHRIKVWLGEPKIDWTKINSYQDLEPYLSRRDETIFNIISDKILKKQKKTVLIIGSGHLVAADVRPGGPRFLTARLNEAYPNALAVLSPFTGYIEPECTAKVVAMAKEWPVPAVVGPIQGTWLKSQLQLPGCNYLPPEQVERMKRRAATGQPPATQWFGPGKPPTAEEMMTLMIGLQTDMRSGVKSDAILYLGPPDTLMESPIDPGIYLDPDYFKEMSHRAQCCTPAGHALDWDRILQQNSVFPKKFETH